MKNKLLSIALLAISVGTLASPTVVAAQSVTSTNASGGTTTITGPQSYFQSISQYFTSFNPAQPIHGKAEIWTGSTYQSSVNIADDFGVRYKVYAPTTNTAIAVESVTRNAGVAGTVVSEQAGAAFCYTIVDTEVSAGVLGGYRFDKSTLAATLFVDARKNLTANTFAGARLAYEIDGDSAGAQPPVISLFAGIEF